MQHKSFSGVAVLVKKLWEVEGQETCQFLCADMPYFRRPSHILHCVYLGTGMYMYPACIQIKFIRIQAGFIYIPVPKNMVIQIIVDTISTVLHAHNIISSNLCMYTLYSPATVIVLLLLTISPLANSKKH